MSINDKVLIQEVVARFANRFDMKDWNGLQDCFTTSLYTDYSDLRGTPSQTLSASEYVRLRREVLDHLKLHHLISNYEVDFTDLNTATCRASMVVWRRSEEEMFSTHCMYLFNLTKTEAGWKISGITQKVLWNEGAASIHQGAK